MILYHGSYMEIDKPDLLHSRPRVDFGAGFYTTLILEQAEKWCGKFKRRGKPGIISRYRLDEAALTDCKVLKFEYYSEEWLDFVLNCRSGKDNSDYDIVIGGVANDKVFNTLELFFENLINKEEALRRLRYEEPNLQICFRSQQVMDEYLKFEGSDEL